MRLLSLCLVWLLGCTAGFAGPWPREAGTAFLSFSIESPEDGDTRDLYYSLYAEYGLTPTLTLGFDGGSDYYDDSEGYFFIRTPLPMDTGRHKFALLGGLGARQTSESVLEAVYVFGGSWGTGFDSPLGPGWATIDATLRDRQDTETQLLKIDTTVGVNRSAGQLWFAQLRYSDDSRAPDAIWELAPSIAFPLTDSLRLETSASVGLQGSQDLKLKLGLWAEF